MLSILKNRSFRLLVTGQAISLFGDWLLLVGLPLYVFSLTGSTFETGLAFVAGVAPALFLSPVGGVLADRYDRRVLGIVFDVSRAATLMPLLLVNGAEDVWIIYVVTFVESALSQLDHPAMVALIPSVVPKSDLVAANQMDSLVTALIRIIGPSSAGVLVALVGLRWMALADSITYLISAGFLVALRTGSRAESGEHSPEPIPQLPGPEGPAVTSIGPEPPVVIPDEAPLRSFAMFKAGIGVVRRSKVISGLLGMFALLMLGQGIINVLYVPFITTVLGGDARQYGAVMGAQGIGAVAGAIAVGGLSRRFAPTRLVSAALFLSALGMFVAVNSGSFALVLAISIGMGVTVAIVLITAQTLIQLTAPGDALGRVIGILAMTMTAAQLVGLAMGSIVGEVVGTVGGINMALGCLVAAAALTALLPPDPMPEEDVDDAGDVGGGRRCWRD